MPSTLLNTLIIAAGLPLLTMTAAPVEASPAWKRAVPYPEASRVATTAANAVISYQNHYSASPLFDQAYFSHVYVQPWCRAQASAVRRRRHD